MTHFRDANRSLTTWDQLSEFVKRQKKPTPEVQEKMSPIEEDVHTPYEYFGDVDNENAYLTKRKEASRWGRPVSPKRDGSDSRIGDTGSVYDATAQVVKAALTALSGIATISRSSYQSLRASRFDRDNKMVEGEVEYMVILSVPSLRRRARIILTVPIREGVARPPLTFRSSLGRTYPLSPSGLFSLLEVNADSIEKRPGSGLSLSPYSVSGVFSSRVLEKNASVGDIPKDSLLTLWYENEDGNKWAPDLEGGFPELPEGFVYQHSSFPNVLHHTVLKLTQRDEVDKCPHEDLYVSPTFGWVDGIEGRDCSMCGGTQIKSTDEDWPDVWDADGSQTLMTMESGYPDDLVLCIANSGDWGLRDAILIVANSCERCMNALAHKYGLDWGYEEGSKEWKKSNTVCDFCREGS